MKHVVVVVVGGGSCSGCIKGKPIKIEADHLRRRPGYFFLFTFAVLTLNRNRVTFVSGCVTMAGSSKTKAIFVKC